MITTILQYELKQLLRKRVLWALLLFVLLGGGYAIGYGWLNYQHYHAQIKEVQQKQAETYAELAPKYDTLTQLGDQAPERLKDYGNPIMADWWYRRYATWSPGSLSALAMGQRDQQTPYQRIQLYRNVNLPELEEINNPEQLLAGNFDLSFVLVYLLPLLVIVLGFNALSQDREEGILSLLKVQGVTPNQLLFTRIALQFGLLWGLSILICSIGFAVVGANWAHWPAWVLGCGAWLLLWVGLVAWVNTWGRSSAFNATVLAGFWIVLLILLPALINFWVDRTYPVLPRSEFMATARDIDSQEWDRPTAVILADFQKAHPDLYSKIPQPIRDTQEIKVFMYNELSIAKVEQLGAPLMRTGTQRLGLENRLKYLNPAYAFNTILTTSAGTELSNFIDWQNATRETLKQNRELINQVALAGKSFKKAEFEQLPTFEAPPLKAQVGGNLLCLGLLAGLLWLLVWWSAQRNSAEV
ncbi:MAG TPA: ABC transporter permease subunit [Haliscomenobacter sp.]|mgnify:FL=1|uniref:ABC transporter permease subunit n=1 Tax=Haliscomenobacter sp. TaxID=2717303 RepID=UPI002BADB131|nr:ABC transporter permease subunit [Haliscomenobacter sp.]HOY20400.1 ABC transporter permease subunit [Haliscomenobacter sp.]